MSTSDQNSSAAAQRARDNSRKAVLGLAAAVVVAGGAAGLTFYLSDADAWVGTVNGRRIPKDSYMQDLEMRKKQFQSRLNVNFDDPSGGAMLDSMKKDAMDQQIQRQIMLEAAEERKIQVHDPEVETRIRTIRVNFPDENAFKAALQENGVTPEALHEQVWGSLLIDKLRAELTRDATVSVEEAQEHYRKNPAQFEVKEEVQAAHILVKTEEEAKDLARRIKKGEDFGNLARQHSEDGGTKANGGDLGIFGRGRMVPEFEKAAFALRPGAVSRPVKTQYGWHVIKVSDRHQARTRPLAEVQGEIVGQLLRQEQDASFREWLKKRRDAAKIVIRPQFKPTEPESPTGATASLEALPAHGAATGATDPD